MTTNQAILAGLPVVALFVWLVWYLAFAPNPREGESGDDMVGSLMLLAILSLPQILLFCFAAVIALAALKFLLG